MRIPRELLEAAKAGEGAAVGALLALAKPIAQRRLARLRRVGRRAVDLDWEGVLQDVLLHVLRCLPGFRGDDGGKFVVWLHRIATCRASDALRASGARVEGRLSVHCLDAEDGADDVAADEPSPLELAELVERRGVLERILEVLPELQRHALRLRYLEGRSFCDVGRQLGLPSANAAECLVRRAVLGLRERWRGIDPG